MPPQSSPNCVWKFAITTGVVCARTEVSSSANRNSFQEARNAKIAGDGEPTVTTGSTTRHSAMQPAAPVDLRGLVELVGHRFEEARHEPDRQWQRDRRVREGESERGVGQPEAAHDLHEGRPTAIVGTIRVTSAAMMNTRPLVCGSG